MARIDPLAPATRVALAGDWHANTEWAVRAIRHLAAQPSPPDVLLHLGDFGWTFEETYILALEVELIRAGFPLLFVDGNHEHHPKLLKRPIGLTGLRRISDHVWHLPRGTRWTWHGVRFLACGGAYSVDRQWRRHGLSWWPQECITDEDVEACGTDGTDVLIAHDCPSGVTIPGVDDSHKPPAWPPLDLLRAGEHRQQLRRIVDATRPRWIWHGHYHTAYRAEVNLGYGPVNVAGLDCEGNLARNLAVIEVADYARQPDLAEET